MSNFTVIHIFHFGQTQLISDGKNYSVDSSALTNLIALVNEIKSLRPNGVNEEDYHAIHCFSGNSYKYMGKNNSSENLTSFKLPYSEISYTLIDNLVAELLSLEPSSEP
mgnify:CR=1 FL=1